MYEYGTYYKRPLGSALKDHLSMQYIETDKSLFLVNIFDSFQSLNFKVSTASAQKSDVYVIWFHVPAGFARADDMKIRFFLNKPPLSQQAGVVQCVQGYFCRRPHPHGGFN